MAVDVILPKVDMDMTTGRITKWFVGEGATVIAGEPLFEIETDKAAMEIEAPANGTLAHVTGAAGIDIAVGATVAWIYESGETAGANPPVKLQSQAVESSAGAPEPETQPIKAPASPQMAGANEAGIKPRATPLARRLAEKAGIALDTVKGSGPRGRITKSDIIRLSASADSPLPVPAAPALAVPQMTFTTECQIDAAIALAAELTASAALTGIGGQPGSQGEIALNDLLVKALAATLDEVAQANVTWTGEAMAHLSDVDIAVAFATPGGQLTPVIRRVQAKSISFVSRELHELAARAESGGLTPADEGGGATSLCNLAMPDIARVGDHLHPPQSTSVILAPGERRPVFAPDGVSITGKTLMSVTLLVDQRAIDGPLANQMLDTFKGFIEEPLLIVV